MTSAQDEPTPTLDSDTERTRRTDMTTTDSNVTGERRTAAPTTAGGTGTRGTRILGIATIVAMGWLVAFGLGFSPQDRDQQEAVRLLYVHVPTIWIAYLAFTVTAIASGMYLFTKKKSLGWDRLAGASAEVEEPREDDGLGGMGAMQRLMWDLMTQNWLRWASAVGSLLSASAGMGLARKVAGQENPLNAVRDSLRPVAWGEKPASRRACGVTGVHRTRRRVAPRPHEPVCRGVRPGIRATRTPAPTPASHPRLPAASCREPRSAGSPARPPCAPGPRQRQRITGC